MRMLNVSSYSHPDINKKPAKKFIPWVYPIFGKYSANFFNIFSSLSRLALLPKKLDYGKVLVTSLAIWEKQGCTYLIDSLQKDSSGT